jgi:hypothetical protein
LADVSRSAAVVLAALRGCADKGKRYQIDVILAGMILDGMARNSSKHDRSRAG